MKKIVIASVVSLVLLVAFGLDVRSPCEAQQKHKRTYKQLGENAKYLVQHNIDVGDIPGHMIRIFKLIRTEPADNPLKYEGVAVKETYEYCMAEYVNWSGHHWAYIVTIMENGDKIYSKVDGTTQTTILAKGGAKGTYNGTGAITGGTGKFRGIRGILRYTGIFDSTIGLNEGTTEEKYWFE